MILLRKHVLELMMKKILFILVVAFLCLSILVGCGTSSVGEATTAINNKSDQETEETLTPEPQYQPPSDELVNGKVPYDNNYDYSSLEFDQVDSSCFSEVSYDINNEILVVRFRDSGALYYYYKITPSFYDSFRSAESLGAFYNENIKGKFSCYRLE